MSTATSAEREAFGGLVERVTYHNAENGFCVLRVKARGQRDLVTVVGAAAAISAGEFIQASGIWINDRTHGLQFKATFLKTVPPTTLEGIERYLGSGMIKGIGPVYANSWCGRRADVFDAIEQVLEILQARTASIALAAPTGRAANRMREATGLEAKTLHRLLEADPVRGGFKRHEEHRLDCELLVVDEVSMVDVPLLHSLLKAVPSRAALILVGDVDQLP